jgi:hypothetical protein
MALCLLSRGLQNCGSSKRGFCFQLSKAMIVLLFDAAPWQSIRSTSQPQQQKSLWRQLSPSPDPVAERAIHQALRCGPNNTEDGRHHRPQQTAEASKKHSVSSSNSPVHSPNTFPPDRLCLVCDAHSSTSCVVCDLDFCSTHLYACVECDNQYCGRCLDDHRADGHWSDSDTAAELSRGWTNNSASSVRIGSLHLSPLPTGPNVFTVTKPCVRVRPAPFQKPSNARRSEISQSRTHQSKRSQLNANRSRPLEPHAHRSKSSHTLRTSPHDTLSAITSLIVFLLQAIRQSLSSSADCVTVSLLAQAEIPQEVSR